MNDRNNNNETINMQPDSSDSNIVRTMVRSVYDLQKLRIQMGNRVTANFKAKLGMKSNGMTEKQLEKQEKKLLDQLREDYRRITDGIIEEGDVAVAKLPTRKKFKGGELITTYAELCLMDQYMKILYDEESIFRNMTKVLEDYPIYTEFLKHVDGVGPAMSAVLMSEIDIHKAEYPSSLHMYAGLDCVTIGVYTDENGKESTVPGWQVDEFYAERDPSEPMIMHGRYKVTFKSVGRSRKDFCLVQREYKDKEGVQKLRNSITFNPFLKTKLVGVLGTSFLRSGTATVDGVKMGSPKRLALAENIGFKEDENSVYDKNRQVNDFLRSRGYDVVVEPSPYGRIYYGYKARISAMPEHKEKTDLHLHNMAIRYMCKIFLNDYYSNARKLENLPVSLTYAEAKLGLEHGVSTEAKETFRRRA